MSTEEAESRGGENVGEEKRKRQRCVIIESMVFCYRGDNL